MYDTIVPFDDVEDLLDIMDPNREMDCGYHNHRERKECNVGLEVAFFNADTVVITAVVAALSPFMEQHAMGSSDGAE